MGYKHSREDLLAAATRLAATSGIGSLTFGSVGASLGISDRTVVYYFPTKDDMIAAVIGALGEQMEATLAAAFGDQVGLPLLEMYTRGVTFHTSRADSRRYLPEVLDLVAAGRLDPLAVPTTVVDWEQADRRWLEPAIKMVVRRTGG